jgi:hypothetical protein
MQPMKAVISILKSAVWALPLCALSLSLPSCFEDGDGYTNVVVPGVVFQVDSLPGDTLYFDSPSKSSKTILIKTNQRDWTSYVVSGSDFCSARKAGGISVSVTENERIAVRTAEIGMKAGGESFRMFVRQKEALPFLRVGTSIVEFDGAGIQTVKTVTVRSNFEWELVEGSAGWYNVEKQPQTTDNMESVITITVTQNNTTGAPRDAEVTFTSQEYPTVAAEKKITIRQKN